MQKLLCAWAVCLAIASVASAQVVINEVNVNDTTNSEWFEVANLGLNIVDISGWQVRGHWDNPADGVAELVFTFPGAANSGTTLIAPDECIVVGESLVDPVLIAGGGGQRFAGISVTYFSGIPGSIVLSDAVGNGQDYFAWSNSNAFDAPLELGTLLSGIPGTATVWTSGLGSPVSTNLASRVGFGANNDANYRISRTDTDTPDDWTNGPTGTPGVLNQFQTPLGGTLFATPGFTLTAQFQPSTTCGIGPLSVDFLNTSEGDFETLLVTWDFDAINNPGVNIAVTSFNASQTFTANADVTLDIIDQNGGNVTSPATAITVAVPNPITPVASAGFSVENFEAFPAFIADPCGGGTAPDGITGFEYRALDAASRVRIVNKDTLAIAFAIPDATAQSGPTVAILDAQDSLATNELIYHIDGNAAFNSGAGGGFTITWWMLENNDEVHAQDVIAFQDGVTAGNGTQQNGTSTGLPGVDGLQEAFLFDWNAFITANGGQRVWVPFSVNVDAAFLAANGLVLSSDMRLIFRQRDNVTFEGNDGLMIDLIEVRPLNPAPGPGQPGDVNGALLDVNGARNANGSLVTNTMDPNGPHFATAAMGGQLDFTFSGEPNQVIVLLSSQILNPGVFTIPVAGAGQLDIGTASFPFPINIQVLGDGSQTDFLNALFNTGPAGSINLSFPANFGAGLLGNFQAVIFNAGTIIRTSNTIELTITP